MNTSRDPFLSRLLWVAVAAAALLVLWQAFPSIERTILGVDATPRVVTPRGDLAAEEKTTIEIFEKAKGSVVYITTRERVMDLWTRNIFTIPKGTGSGFIWDERGHVVTNYHVMAGASGAQVRLSDGREHSAGLVGASPAHDLAVLRIGVALNRPPPVLLGTSQNLKVGQKVFAIGNPFGLDWTLTTGVVSALDRSLPSDQGGVIEHLIQTDAAINPGNSGGPLLDSAGRLIGINTAIFSPSGTFAGIGFAVPVDTVNRVVPELIASGKYVRPALGIEVDEDLNRQVTQKLGVEGVLVLRVMPGSAAEAAGMQGARIDAEGITPGDIIVSLDDKPVDSVAKLLGRLDDFRVGDAVRVTVLRESGKTELTVTLQAGG
ncbi:MAG: trypsin-like peptidase domain-containing protein [Pseudomonadota bacterium]|nr:trypsin-like peptidase domain-containing protein [Pseudomonadota bacterium]